MNRYEIDRNCEREPYFMEVLNRSLVKTTCSFLWFPRGYCKIKRQISPTKINIAKPCKAFSKQLKKVCNSQPADRAPRINKTKSMASLRGQQSPAPYPKIGT